MEKRTVKRKAQIDRRECVACGCCVKVCPRQAIWVDRGLFARVEETLCIGCGKCAKECPASVIAMEEVPA